MFRAFNAGQRMALSWMVSKENSSHCTGGILADEQVVSDFQTSL
jgi:hypothetical protein